MSEHIRTKIFHFRRLRDNSLPRVKQSADPKGGVTMVLVDNEKIGIAVCSVRDSYNKKLGAHIAVGRVMKTDQTGVPPVWKGCALSTTLLHPVQGYDWPDVVKLIESTAFKFCRNAGFEAFLLRKDTEEDYDKSMGHLPG